VKLLKNQPRPLFTAALDQPHDQTTRAKPVATPMANATAVAASSIMRLSEEINQLVVDAAPRWANAPHRFLT
jgi:hypothetical protein